MSIVLKALCIAMVIVLAIGILGTVIGVGTNLVRYMKNQNFGFRNALNWSWTEFINWVATINPFKAAEEQTIPMANQFVNVVACTDL